MIHFFPLNLINENFYLKISIKLNKFLSIYRLFNIINYNYIKTLKNSNTINFKVLLNSIYHDENYFFF